MWASLISFREGREENNDDTPCFEFGSTYRPDIDGLRAAAVAAVILFHAEIPGFSGGFVGVDVFYVISGYLITQVLTESSEQPLHLQLAGFYVRRARRILPALLATSLIVAVAAVAILLPWDLARFGRYLAATAVLGMNIAAWSDGIGYFQSRLAQVPITHFWSVATEEQFYLIYPITLALIGKYFHRHRASALAVLGGIVIRRLRLGLLPCAGGQFLPGAVASLGTAAGRNARPERHAVTAVEAHR